VKKTTHFDCPQFAEEVQAYLSYQKNSKNINETDKSGNISPFRVKAFLYYVAYFCISFKEN